MANIEKDQGRFQGLQDHKVAFDQDKMWKKVKPKEKKNRMFIWFFGTLILILGTMLFLNELEITDKNSNNINNASKGNLKNEAIHNNQQESTVLTKESEIINNALDNQQLEIDNSDLKATANQKLKSISGAHEDYAFEIQQNKTQKSELNQSRDNTAVNFDLEMVKTSDSIGEGITNKKQVNITYEPKSQQLFSPGLKENTIATTEKDLVLIVPIHRLQIFPLNITSKQYEINKVCSFTNLSSRPQQSSLGFGGYVGYGLVSKQLSGINQDYINSRRSSEHELENLEVGFKITYSFKKWLYLKSGVEYNRLATKFDFQNSEVASITNVDPTILPSNLQGQKGIIKIVNNSTYYNNYHSVNIPLSFGVKHRINRLSLGLETGINYYLYQRYDGYLANERLGLEILEETPKNLNHLGYTSSIIIGTNIFGRHTFISPTIMYFPKNSILGINETYISYKLRVGVHF